MEQEQLQFIYYTLTNEQKVKFFINLIDLDYDLNEAVFKLISEDFPHEEIVDINIFPGNKIIVGMDFNEIPVIDDPDDIIVENFIHFYSNRKSNIDEYIAELFESGEIITTVITKQNYKLRHYKCVKSLNFENRMERPLIPIVYN